MFTDNKVTEIFFMADEFCKFFDAMMAKYIISNPRKRKYYRENTMFKAEVMLIIILFHDSTIELPEAFLYGKSLQTHAASFPESCFL